MNRDTMQTLAAMTMVWLGIVLPGGDVFGQQSGNTFKEQLVGTWLLESIHAEQPDASKIDPFGANPTGILIFDGNGHFAAQFVSSGLPKFVSNNRLKGTPEENKAIVQGSICYFGTYSVSEADQTLNYHIEGSSFPNFNRTDQKRTFSLTGDEMKYTGPTSTGGTSHAVWKRAK